MTTPGCSRWQWMLAAGIWGNLFQCFKRKIIFPEWVQEIDSKSLYLDILDGYLKNQWMLALNQPSLPVTFDDICNICGDSAARKKLPGAPAPEDRHNMAQRHKWMLYHHNSMQQESVNDQGKRHVTVPRNIFPLWLMNTYDFDIFW